MTFAVAGRVRVRSLVLGAVAVLGACGGEDPSGPSVGPPSSFQVTAGANQQAAVGTALATSPSVRLVDANGRGVSGRSVRFDVIGGGGSVTGDSVVTDADGRATVGSWLLGPIPGVNQLRVQALGTPINAIIEATAQVGAPSQVTIIDGAAGLAAIVGQEVTPRPSLRFRDAFGNPVPGVAVTFTVTAGGGTVTGAQVTTNADGRATVGSWRLGPSSGVNRLQATTANGVGTVFIAQGIGIPAALAPASPVDQSGFTRFAVPKIPRVRVLDADGRPIEGIPVQFSLAPGSDGLLSGTSATTNADGIAAPGDWKLGNSGSSTVLASVPNFPALSAEFRATGVPTPFALDVRFLTSTTPNQRDVFVTAALRWMQIITGDLPDQVVNLGAGSCGQGSPALGETVDDIILFASVTAIDGPGSILGSAGPCTRRAGSNLTVVGQMRFDEADLANIEASNRLEAVIVHEMGHVLGIGTNWQVNGVVQDIGTDDPIFIGPQAVAAWPLLGSSFTGRIVPVENTGDSGTAGGHWRETILEAELMTGFVEAGGVAMPISILTVASLADIGFTVNAAAAEPFTAGLRDALGALSGTKLRLYNDIEYAKFEVDRSGRVRRLP